VDSSVNRNTAIVHGPSMASTVIVAGLGVAAFGFGARFMLRTIPAVSDKLAKNIPKISPEEMFANSKYYKGGFDEKMSKREAALILGVRPGAPTSKVKGAYMKMMRNNHPDIGGSPYLSTKISEAKEVMDKK